MFKFKIEQEDDYRLLLVDITRSSESDLPEVIHSIELSILGDLLDEKIVISNILSSMFINRKSNLIYEVDSNTLGFGKEVAIPDGTYTFILKFNNTLEYTVSVLVVTEIQAALKELMNSIPEDTTIINEFDIDTTVSDNIVRFYHAMSLYGTLIYYTSGIYDSDKVTETMNTLNNILGVTNIII